jgi:hypothetical protein
MTDGHILITIAEKFQFLGPISFDVMATKPYTNRAHKHLRIQGLPSPKVLSFDSNCNP